MMQHNHVLYLITAEYPYGRGETFLENEINVLAKRFNNVVLIPLCKDNQQVRSIPNNVSVDKTLMHCVIPKTSTLFYKNFSYLLKLLLIELVHTNKKKYFILNIKSIIGILASALYKSMCFQKQIIKKEELGTTNYYYSFWMDEGALLLSILKEKKKIDGFVFRVLGYDLYDERREGGYMPFRYFNFKMTKKIFCISKDGFNYLKKKNIFPEKLSLSYLSVFDNGINLQSENGPLTLVSCSNLISLKRVHLIIEILKQVTVKVNWVHFGDGVLKSTLLTQTEDFPENIKVDFKGQTSNTAILNFYKNNSVDLFIQLSETEGGAPVAMQEAASFGIPLIGTNAGGIPEIATAQTGVLLPLTFNIAEVAEIINQFHTSKMKTISFRQQVRQFWFENFNAEINYNKLCDQILSE
jgi:glycosyltransferase involved in cell wall biosynthesis